MMNKMDEIFKRVLNDRDIFKIRKEIFSAQEWKELEEAKSQFEQYKNKNIIDKKIKALEDEKDRSSNNRRGDIEQAIKLCRNLLISLKEKPNILNQMFDYLDSFGVVEFNLPDMDNYGKVIERLVYPRLNNFSWIKLTEKTTHTGKKH